MKALLLKEYKRLEIVEFPMPQVGAGDVLVRVKACGICGSDVHGYDGSTGRRIPPLIMGHEASGVVEEIGSEVRQVRAGDRITFDSTVYCGKCAYCRRGEINLCDNRNVLGVSCGDYRRHGAFAEYLSIPQHIVYKLPDSLSFEQAAMVEAVSVAVHAVNRTPVRLGATVVVVGAGMIGQLVVQVVRLSGCGRLIVVDLEDTKLRMVLNFGADATVNASAPDLVDRIHELTGGEGADIAFEAVGSGAAFATAVTSLRKGGTVTLIGNLSPQVEMPLQQVVTRELSLYGSCASRGEYPACIELMARGRIDVRPFMSACAPLQEGPAWFERLYQRDPGLMKVILNP
jgi:L-iditol 2-dehydrogenase